jgi:hypothetical protein
MTLSESALPIVEKPASVRQLGPVDVSALLAVVTRMTDRAWASEDSNKENRFDCFHHTRHTIFRFIPRNGEAEDFYEMPAWPIWSPILRPIMEAAVAGYGFERPVFPKAMLARLEAGQLIDRHRDGAGSNLRTHKIHVPLVTNPDALFEAGGERVHLAFGNAYEVNNIGDHAASNQGAADRIHLIFEVFDGRHLPAGRQHGDALPDLTLAG